MKPTSLQTYKILNQLIWSWSILGLAVLHGAPKCLVLVFRSCSTKFDKIRLAIRKRNCTSVLGSHLSIKKTKRIDLCRISGWMSVEVIILGTSVAADMFTCIFMRWKCNCIPLKEVQFLFSSCLPWSLYGRFNKGAAR